MGWQKRGKGHNSRTGHAAVMSLSTGEVLDYTTRVKTCRFCDYAKNNEAKVHDCHKNHTASSKAMEPDAAVSKKVNQDKIRKSVVEYKCQRSQIHANNCSQTARKEAQEGTTYEISLKEVIWQFQNLKTSKVTDIDNIPAKVPKNSAQVVGLALTYIYNLSTKTGIYVDEWKKACVMPIFKSEDRQKCENYRPISILPIISKILERLI